MLKSSCLISIDSASVYGQHRQNCRCFCLNCNWSSGRTHRLGSCSLHISQKPTEPVHHYRGKYTLDRLRSWLAHRYGNRIYVPARGLAAWCIFARQKIGPSERPQERFRRTLALIFKCVISRIFKLCRSFLQPWYISRMQLAVFGNSYQSSILAPR